MVGSPDEFNGGGVWTTRWYGVAPTAWLYNALSDEPFHLSIGPGLYDDTHSGWTYTGNWAKWTGTGPYQNTFHYSSTTGSDYATFTFEGTMFELTYSERSSRGEMDIFVDNSYVTTLNAYNLTPTWQKSWTLPSALSSGYHTVKIVHKSGAYIDIDAIGIFDTTSQNQVITLINQERANAGLPALSANALLTEAALRHSDDMASNDFVSHTGSDGSTMGDRATDAGYDWTYIGETIAAGQSTPADAVATWMASSGHRDIILSPNFDDIGVGYVYLNGSTYGHYWTVNFGAQ